MDYHLIYGALEDVASYTPLGSSCDLGTSGTGQFLDVPSDDLWFLIAGDDDDEAEGSWGAASDGSPRGGGAPSGECGLASRDDTASCR